jgi:hypothetical protein
MPVNGRMRDEALIERAVDLLEQLDPEWQWLVIGSGPGRYGALGTTLRDPQDVGLMLCEALKQVTNNMLPEDEVSH